MVELREGLILSKGAPKEAISFSFVKGSLNKIPYTQKYIYSFLKLKDQALDKGEFFIDDFKVYPEENSEKSLFVLAINSVVKFLMCFLVDKVEKKQKVQNVQAELIKLREMPTTSDFEKNAKIAAIFDKILELSPSYLLADLNEEENRFNSELDRHLNRIAGDINTIVLEEKPIDVVEENKVEYDEIIDLSIGQNTTSQYIKVQKQGEDYIIFDEKNGKKGFGRLLLNTFKNNLMVFMSFLIPTLGIIAFSLLTPLYLKTENKFLAIPFIITIVICMFLYLLMTYKCTEFTLDYEHNKDKIISYFIINTIVALVGGGLGIVIYVLFKNFDNDLKALEGGNTIGIILAIIFAVILLTANLYLRLLINPIIDKIKKKK